MLQLPIQSFRYTSIFPYISEESKVDFLQVFKQIFNSTEVEEAEIIFLDPNKQFIYTKLSAVSYIDNELNEQLCRCTVTDVTEIKQINEKARLQHEIAESQKQFSLLFENMTNAFVVGKVVTDAKGNPTDFTIEILNKKFEQLINKKKEDVLGKKFKEVIEVIDDTWTLIFCNVGLTCIPYSGEYFSVVFKRYFKVNVYSTQKGYFAIVLDDITERYRTTEKLQANSARLHDLLALSQLKMPDIQSILNYSLNTAVKITNSNLGYIYHYSESENKFILNSWSDSVMPQCKVREPRLEYQLEKTGVWGEVVRQRKPIILNDFQSFHPLKKGYPAGHVELTRFLSIPFFVNNQIVAVVGVANKQDEYDDDDILQLNLLMETVWAIFNQKNLESEIVSQNKKLAELNASKDKFFSIIAHDLKNPFNSIFGFSELLIKNIETYDKAKISRFINTIYESSKNTFKLLENLLEWSRAQTGKIEFKPENIILEHVLVDIIQLLDNLVKEKNITITYLISDSFIVFADKNMLNTVLRNLLSNAIKFTHKNGLIVVSAERIANEIEISVQDNGVGISSSVVDKLFSTSDKISTLGTDSEIGTGLGLILCKEFVTKHNGKIWVESDFGKGSCFKFTLPAGMTIK